MSTVEPQREVRSPGKVRQSACDDAAPGPRQLALSIENGTLTYPVGTDMRGSLKSLVLSLFGHREPVARKTFITALSDVRLAFDVGERIALIGHNGSGKSTLLRTLAGIYPLQEGRVVGHGKIGTLLDFSLGFESESTGRENIYHRGMTMGYSRRQMSRVEDEIVAFADLGEFIDLPMRTYSTGMFVRLGFAISTQFAPDILLVDEVFGAGDAAFAKKALGRMLEIVRQSGIFVIATHDLSLIRNVCSRAVWMDGGRVVEDGSPEQVLQNYERHMLGEPEPTS